MGSASGRRRSWGRFADLVVLDRGYFTVSDAAMRDTRPVLTVIGGRVVHDTLR